MLLHLTTLTLQLVFCCILKLPCNLSKEDYDPWSASSVVSQLSCQSKSTEMRNDCWKKKWIYVWFRATYQSGLNQMSLRKQIWVKHGQKSQLWAIFPAVWSSDSSCWVWSSSSPCLHWKAGQCSDFWLCVHACINAGWWFVFSKSPESSGEQPYITTVGKTTMSSSCVCTPLTVSSSRLEDWAGLLQHRLQNAFDDTMTVVAPFFTWERKRLSRAVK